MAPAQMNAKPGEEQGFRDWTDAVENKVRQATQQGKARCLTPLPDIRANHQITFDLDPAFVKDNFASMDQAVGSTNTGR